MSRLVQRAVVTTVTIAAYVMVPAPQALASSAGWIVFCPYSHSAMDDPIVHPGQPGAAHLHDFLGNTTTRAASTYRTMTAGATTCAVPKDTGGYWVPALSRNGVKVDPAGSYAGLAVREVVYYRGDNLAAGTRFVVPPADFRMVAGNAAARTPAENPYLGREIYWDCSDNSKGKLISPANCSTGIVSLHVGFPNCWNGVTNPVDDTPNVAYPSSYRCPVAFPVAIPRVILRLEYPVGRDSSGITLASGATFTEHGDFWNTWRQPALKTLVNRCLNHATDCGNNPAV